MPLLSGAPRALQPSPAVEPGEEAYSFGGSTGLEQERRELLEAVQRGLKTRPADPDRTAACAFLLRHLARTARMAGH